MEFEWNFILNFRYDRKKGVKVDLVIEYLGPIVPARYDMISTQGGKKL